MREEYIKRSRGSADPGGFTVTEIIVVLAIIMCLAGVAFPIFTKISYSIRLKSAATNLSGLMQNARIAAAKNNTVYVSSTCSTPATTYFVYYLEDARGDGTTGWAAVVVTRTGRTKSYTWNGASWN